MLKSDAESFFATEIIMNNMYPSERKVYLALVGRYTRMKLRGEQFLIIDGNEYFQMSKNALSYITGFSKTTTVKAVENLKEKTLISDYHTSETGTTYIHIRKTIEDDSWIKPGKGIVPEFEADTENMIDKLICIFRDLPFESKQSVLHYAEVMRESFDISVRDYVESGIIKTDDQGNIIKQQEQENT